jgi:hypothetical protein
MGTGCHVMSAKDPHGRILGFIDRSRVIQAVKKTDRSTKLNVQRTLTAYSCLLQEMLNIIFQKSVLWYIRLCCAYILLMLRHLYRFHSYGPQNRSRYAL